MLGMKIRELRKKANLTQQELAEGILTRSYLSQIEKGTVTPTYDLIKKLSHKLNCNIEDIFSETVDSEISTLELQKNIKIALNHIETEQSTKLNKTVAQIKVFNTDNLPLYDLAQINYIYGYNEFFNKNYKKSEEYFKSAIEMFEKTSTFSNLMKTLNILGATYIKQNRLNEALPILRKSYSISIQEIFQNKDTVILLLFLGILHGKLKESHSAIHFLNEAKNLNILLGTFYKMGDICMSLGICHMETNNYEEAEKEFLQAINYFKLVKDNKLLVANYTNLGILYTKVNQVKKGINLLLLSLDLLNKHNLQTELDINNIQLELSVAYIKNNDLQISKRICEDLLTEKLNPQYLSQTYEILGDIYYKEENYDLSLSYYLNSLNVIETINELTVNANSLNNLLIKVANIFSIKRDIINANKYYQRVLII